MPDMLVKLYNLPPLAPLLDRQRGHGIEIRRAMAPEKRIIIDWVARHWGAGWASECEVAFARLPITCWIAVAEGRPLGFACHDATLPNFFGPTGVLDECQGRGTGAALLVAALQAMADAGYAYAIIGGVGPAEFYSRVAGAVLIEDSTPGPYRGLIGEPPAEGAGDDA
ncbi:MAG TPA: GNAT family N-acetyltransferase [Herpetosiphonaceae bacterium]